MRPDPTYKYIHPCTRLSFLKLLSLSPQKLTILLRTVCKHLGHVIISLVTDLRRRMHHIHNGVPHFNHALIHGPAVLQ
jgi:hypothetical protein